MVLTAKEGPGGGLGNPALDQPPIHSLTSVRGACCLNGCPSLRESPGAAVNQLGASYIRYGLSRSREADMVTTVWVGLVPSGGSAGGPFPAPLPASEGPWPEAPSVRFCLWCHRGISLGPVCVHVANSLFSSLQGASCCVESPP